MYLFSSELTLRAGILIPADLIRKFLGQPCLDLHIEGIKTVIAMYFLVSGTH